MAAPKMGGLFETVFLDWLKSVALPALNLYGTALLGSLLMYFFAATKGLEGTIPRLKQLLPGKDETLYYRLDFFIVIVVGPIVGLICFQPEKPLQALAAGCGWVAALNVLIQQKPTPEQFGLGQQAPRENGEHAGV